MIGNFLQLSADELAALINDPSSVESFIYPDEEENENSIDIDKAWHGIHFLLTGDPWEGEPPLANAVLGGTEIGDDVGYGSARYLTVDEVRAVADALKEIPPDNLSERYALSELAKNNIYPEIWDEDDADNDANEYLTSWYETLRDYYIDAATKGNGMLKYLN